MTSAAVNEIQELVSSLPPDLRESVEIPLFAWIQRDAAIALEFAKDELRIQDTRGVMNDLRREMEAVRAERDLLRMRLESKRF